MMKTVGTALLLCLIYAGDVRAICADKWVNISPAHTMCLPKRDNAVKLTSEEKAKIVDLHNQYRSEVSPTAGNMIKMTWNDDLAKVAKRWAMQCTKEHEADNSYRRLPGNPDWVGQNIAWGNINIEEALELWHDELNDWHYDYIGAYQAGIVGHYEQMIWHSSDLVGCGAAQCSFGLYVVCNYHNMPMIGQYPYKNSRSCADCSGNCEDDLCVCENPVQCQNGGTRNLSNCECSCKEPYIPPSCEDVDCSVADEAFCSWMADPASCAKYSNFPRDCRHECGLC